MLRWTVVRRCADGSIPQGLSPAALELMKRLQAHSTKKTKQADPARAVKLVDRLKDLHLQGHWARAMTLFDNHPAESRVWRWQAFHYRILLQMLGDSKQTSHGLRVWDVMRERPEISLDERTANDALVVLAAADTSGSRLQELHTMMSERNFSISKQANRALDARRESDWQAALADLALTSDLFSQPSEGGSSSGNSDSDAAAGAGATNRATAKARIEKELLRLMARHAANSDAFSAIRGGLAAIGATESGDVYAFRIRASPDWEDALTIMHECVATTKPTARTYNELLTKLFVARQAPAMKPVIDHMNGLGIQHNKYTVEAVMKYFETTPDWAEATRYFLAMKVAGVPPTNRGYGSLIKAYNRGGQASRVMPVFEAMRKDGFQGDAKDTVSLINAWSANRSQRLRGR